MTLTSFGAICFGYLLGSIPVAHIITRWRTGLNIRQVGDGNAGARNVWHVVGPGWGTLVAVLDAIKGATAVVLARLMGASPAGVVLVGPAAILGHAYPLFLHFEGGKGLATTVGILLAWTPISTLISLAVLVVGQLVLRNFDRTVVLVAATAIFSPLAFGQPWSFCLYALFLFCLLWVRKLHDLPHERRVWAQSGWEGVEQSDWYDETTADSAMANSKPNGSHQ